MEDEFDLFTPSQRETIRSYVASIGALRNGCPSCGSRSMHVTGFLRHPLFKQPTDEQTQRIATWLVITCG